MYILTYLKKGYNSLCIDCYVLSSSEILTRLIDKVENRFYGKYRGYITDNMDPLGLGRIKAKVPKILKDEKTGWCLPCMPYGGGADRGFFMIPEINSSVWIEFEGGDPSYPIWTGTWWGSPESTGGIGEFGEKTGNEVPQEAQVSPEPTIKIIKTSKGHKNHFG